MNGYCVSWHLETTTYNSRQMPLRGKDETPCQGNLRLVSVNQPWILGLRGQWEPYPRNPLYQRSYALADRYAESSARKRAASLRDVMQGPLSLPLANWITRVA